jgi:glycerate dehydrogenase
MEVLIASLPGRPGGVGRVALDELLPRVDVLSLHCPLTPETRGLIGARELDLLRPEAFLINTARGALVDGGALAAALRAGRLAGAGIDVLPEEPPVHGDPLLADDIPNLIVTPHVAWAAMEARQRAVDEVAANIASFLAGGRRGRVA